MKLIGDLKFGHYKSIDCNVHLKIETYEEDDWAEPDPNYKADDYLDGMRVTGELYFDTSPITDPKHPVRVNAVGEISVRDEGTSSVLNVILVEKTGVVDIVPQKIKRYFWHFLVVGKPKIDSLEIFPKDYLGINMNKLYSCIDFRGYWPVQVASVVVAADKREARVLLDEKLKLAGIPIEDIDYTLTEINIRQKGATILNNGDWK